MSKYQVIEKHTEIGEMENSVIYYNLIAEFEESNYGLAKEKFKDIIDSQTSLWEDDVYYLTEIKESIFITDNDV